MDRGRLTHRWSRRLPLAACLSVVCFIGACGEPTEAESAEVVRSALKKGDIKAAIIESKSAVQRRPQSAEARFLLGKALFESGDPVGAVQELEKARELRFDDNQLLPLLARGVLLSTGLPSKVVERFADAKLSEPVAGADLKAQVGHAFFTLGKTDRADSEAVAALQLDAKNVHAQLLRALVAARRNAFDDALARVDAVIAQDPKNLSAWTLKGDLLYGAKMDRAGAEKSYRQALAISPSWVQAHLGLLTLFRHQDDKAKFRSQVGELKQAAPASLHAALFDTELALMDNDLPRARTGAQRLLVGAPRNSQVLSLAGQVALRTGAVDQARSHFAKAVQAQPEDAAPRLGLAAAMLRMGQAAEAISTLQPLLSSDRPSTDALQLAASAHLQNGDAAKADQYYERALKAMADDPRAKVALALSKVAKGDSTALASLEAMAATDKDAVADMALVSHHLSTGDLKAALKYVDQLQRKLPEDPLPHLLRGRVLRQMNDNVGARASLERVLLADANHFAAISELATLDLAENKIDQLRARFEGLLKREPKNFRAMLTLADIHQRSGAKPEVVEGQILAAIAAAPFESTPRLALVEYRLGQRKSALALTAAQEAVAAFPDDHGLREALGRAQWASGDSQQALATFNGLLNARGVPADVCLRVAHVFLGMRNYESAEAAIRKALVVAPDFVEAQKTLIDLAMLRKRPAQAMDVARQVQKQRPTRAIGHLMEAEITAAQQNWDGAIGAMREALARERTTQLAARLHSLYLAAGRKPAAGDMAAGWLRDNPGDLGFMFHLAAVAVGAKDYPAAEAQYRAILAVQPEHPTSLNDLAWVLLQQGKPGAVQLAEKANRLLPSSATFMDTLSQALQAEKQNPQALLWAQKAVAAAPNKPEYRMNLAKCLIASGERDKARTELRALAALGSGFSAQADVSRLLREL